MQPQIFLMSTQATFIDPSFIKHDRGRKGDRCEHIDVKANDGHSWIYGYLPTLRLGPGS